MARARILAGLAAALVLYLLWHFFVGFRFPSAPPTSVGYKVVELASQSFESPFLDLVTWRLSDWNIAGDVVVENDKFVALASDKPHQAGLLFNKSPLDAKSFRVELTFHIHSASKLSADGLALWLTESPSPIGDVFGARGEFVGLGIFVDTFRNGPTGHFPYVSAQLGRGEPFYNRNDDGFSTKLVGCTAKSLLNPSLGKTTMRVIYLHSGYLSVDFNYDPDNSDNWQQCFSVDDVRLPSTKFLGFSAETGDVSEHVEIFKNKVHALYEPASDLPLMSIEHWNPSVENTQNLREDSSGRKNKQRRRKSAQRLRLMEERQKQRDRARRMAAYGDSDATFVRRTWAKFVKAVKIVMSVLLLTLVAWIARLVMKTRKQKRRSHTTGILD